MEQLNSVTDVAHLEEQTETYLMFTYSGNQLT